MGIFNEISWPQFRELNHIRNLSLNEQTQQYNKYKCDLDVSRMNWLKCNNGGKKKETLQNVGFLLQEDLFNLQQEDGNNIFITEYA